VLNLTPRRNSFLVLPRPQPPIFSLFFRPVSFLATFRIIQQPTVRRSGLIE